MTFFFRIVLVHPDLVPFVRVKNVVRLPCLNSFNRTCILGVYMIGRVVVEWLPLNLVCVCVCGFFTKKKKKWSRYRLFFFNIEEFCIAFDLGRSGIDVVSRTTSI